MFGKHFASTYTGSMLGAGADVFAVWGYVIGNTVDSQVELNPRLLAAVIGMAPEAVERAIAYLCAPDAQSRNKIHDGRRLLREGEFAYRVTGHALYRAVGSEQQENVRPQSKAQRAREGSQASILLSMTFNDFQTCQPKQKTRGRNRERKRVRVFSRTRAN